MGSCEAVRHQRVTVMGREANSEDAKKKRFYTEYSENAAGTEKKNGESGDSPGKKFKKQKKTR